MRRCWYNMAQTADAALFSAFRRALKSPEVLQVWGLQTCTSIDSPRSRVLQLQGLVTIMAMSAGDSPRDLQGLRGSPSDQRERGGTESLVGLSDNLRGDTLSDCFFSLWKKSPNPHICTQGQRLVCPVIIFNRIHRTRTLLCSLHKPQPYKKTAFNLEL